MWQIPQCVDWIKAFIEILTLEEYKVGLHWQIYFWIVLNSECYVSFDNFFIIYLGVLLMLCFIDINQNWIKVEEWLSSVFYCIELEVFSPKVKTAICFYHIKYKSG